MDPIPEHDILHRLVADTPSPWLIKKYATRRILVRVIVYIGCAIACTIQCASILDMYLSYPTTVFVYMERMANLESPGITVCNNNR